MASRNPQGSAVAALNAQIDAAVAIIQPLATFVKDAFAEAAKAKKRKLEPVEAEKEAPETNKEPQSNPEIDALALARDASTLVRAHGTKISLLMVNEPFTPTAIGKVVQELVNGPVPALAKAVELCDGDRYTNHMRQELARRCGTVLDQVRQLLQAVPRDGHVVPEAKRTGTTTSTTSVGGSGSSSKALTDRGSYTKIGILWAECDGVVALCKRGVGGHLVQVVNQVADMLRDEQEELKEWGDEEDDAISDGEDDDDDVDDSGYDDALSDDNGGQGPHDAAQAMLDALMATRHIPPDDPDELRPRLETALKKIRLVVLLCRAVVKRRLTPLPVLPSDKMPGDVAARLDSAVVALQTISSRFEDLAAAFYKLEAPEVDAVMGECFTAAVAASDQLARPWTGTHDEFTDWARKFQTEMQIAAAPGS